MAGSEIIRKIAALKLSTEAMSEVLSIIADMEAAHEADKALIAGRRKKDAERKRDARTFHGHSTDSPATIPDTVSPKKETSPTPPKEKITPSIPLSESAREFAEFWSQFPNKVGKRDAEREFLLALKRASFAAIMAGLQRYVAKTDDRPWCNPSTFLHQDRWADQPATAPRPHSTASPKKLTQGESLRNMAREAGVIDDTGNPIRRLETSDRDGENPSTGDVIRLAFSGNHGW